MTDSFVTSGWAIFLSLIFICVVCGITGHNMFRHLVNYTRPHLQNHILRVLLVTPIIVFFSFIALCAPGVRYVMAVLRDTWEAVVIYSFLMLVLEYMGGEHLCLNSIASDSADHTVPLKEFHYIWPLSLCFGPIPPENMIRLPKRCALQFVFTKPIMTVLELLLYAKGEHEDLMARLFINLVYNVSYSTALFGLYLIYTASKNHVALQDKQCMLKFVSVKMVVFLTFWQGYIFPLLIRENQERWQDFILIVEAAVFSVLMYHSFNWQEFSPEAQAKTFDTPSRAGATPAREPQISSMNFPSQRERSSLGSLAQQSSPAFTPAISPGNNFVVAGSSYQNVKARSLVSKEFGDDIVPRVVISGRDTGSSQNVLAGTHAAPDVVGASSLAQRIGREPPSTTTPQIAMPAPKQKPKEDAPANAKSLVQLDTYDIGDLDGFSSSQESSPQPQSPPQIANFATPAESTRQLTSSAPGVLVAPPTVVATVDDVNLAFGPERTTTSGSAGEASEEQQTSAPVMIDIGGQQQTSADQQKSSASHQARQKAAKILSSLGGVVNANKPRPGEEDVNATPQWLQNAKSVFNPRDVISDAKRSFSTRYNQHVLMESDAQDSTLDSIEVGRRGQKQEKSRSTDSLEENEDKENQETRTFPAAVISGKGKPVTEISSKGGGQKTQYGVPLPVVIENPQSPDNAGGPPRPDDGI